MRVKVLKAFADKELIFKMYEVGEIINLPDERAELAIEKGLAESIETAKAEETPKATKKRKKG